MKGASVLSGLLLMVLLGCSGAGGTSDSDVGASLACEKVIQSYEQILADPVAHAGEMGAIIGAAESADDPELHDAAREFLNTPNKVAAFQRIRYRCVVLGFG